MDTAATPDNLSCTTMQHSQCCLFYAVTTVVGNNLVCRRMYDANCIEKSGSNYTAFTDHNHGLQIRASKFLGQLSNSKNWQL